VKLFDIKASEAAKIATAKRRRVEPVPEAEGAGGAAPARPAVPADPGDVSVGTYPGNSSIAFLGVCLRCSCIAIQIPYDMV